MILVAPTEYNDPLLAAWQYGLGRSVAFTSDASARWGADWLGWDDFSRFWSQAVRWTITEGTNDNLETRVVMEGEQARVVVDARDTDGDFLNGLALSTSLVDPNLGAQAVPLRQVAPGRYEAVFTPTAEGAYFLAVTGEGGTDGTPVQVNQRTGWVMSYSPEYSLRSSAADLDLLNDIATLTDGRSLAGDPGAAFAHNLDLETASTPLYPWLLLASLLLLPLDIAVRRLIVTRTDLARLRNAALGGGAVPADVPSERLAGLMDAKARAQQKTGQSAEPTSTAAALRNRRAAARDTLKGEPLPAPPTTRSADAPTRTTGAASPSAPAQGGNIAGRLLDKRKERDPNTQ